MADRLTLLKDLITAASVCLAPSVAWLTFAASWSQRLRDQRAGLRRQLVEVEQEISNIDTWARTEYPDASSHSDNWRNPFWRVNDFPTERLRDFNRLTEAGQISQRTSDTCVALEASAERFRVLLRGQQEFVWGGLQTGLLQAGTPRLFLERKARQRPPTPPSMSL